MRVYEVSLFGPKFRLTGFHLVFGVILLCALPQILYLCSRNIEFVASQTPGFRSHLDEFWSGSTGNCGLPGNEACSRAKAASDPPSLQPGLRRPHAGRRSSASSST